MHALLPGEPEPAGLLALMLLHHARRPARVGAGGELVLLEEQDRARWDRARDRRGAAARRGALTLRRPPGPYALQAAIAARPRPRRARRGHRLAARSRCSTASSSARCRRPVVALNRAVAVAMADGPAAGLAIIDDPLRAGALDGYHLLHAARADLLRRLGRREEAGGRLPPRARADRERAGAPLPRRRLASAKPERRLSAASGGGGLALELARRHRQHARAQVAHLGVVAQRQRALADGEALGSAVGARERVRQPRPGATRVGRDRGRLLAGRHLGADIVLEVGDQREIEKAFLGRPQRPRAPERLARARAIEPAHPQPPSRSHADASRGACSTSRSAASSACDSEPMSS